jgi:hypothetical protein
MLIENGARLGSGLRYFFMDIDSRTYEDGRYWAKEPQAIDDMVNLSNKKTIIQLK